MTQHIRAMAAIALLSIVGMVAFVLVDATPGTAAQATGGRDVHRHHAHRHVVHRHRVHVRHVHVRHVHARHVHAHHRHRHPRPRGRRDLYGVTRRMMAMAEKVSICEEGGNWHYVGNVFDGGIGWTLANWAQFRKPTWPRHMHQASPHMQANALFRFVRHYHIAMPDQSGVCAGY